MELLLIKRSTTFIMRFDARPQLDLAAMLRGNLAVVRDEPLVAASSATGATTKLSDVDLRLLSALSSADWTPADAVLEKLGIERQVLDDLIRRQLVLADGDEAEMAAARRREEHLTSMQWDEDALRYHVSSRCQGTDAGAPLKAPTAVSSPDTGTHTEDEVPPAPGLGQTGLGPAGLGRPGIGPAEAKAPAELAPHLAIASMLGQQLHATVAQFGPPPPHFHHPEGVLSSHDLPAPVHQGWFLDLLRRRRTVRLYDPDDSMTLEELSTVLYYTYGCHGVAPMAPGVVGLKKTSPSGGAMHPIEVYPLILQARGVPPGLYHYDIERHALELLRALDVEAGRRLAETFTSGQTYYGTAHVLFVLTARFFRNFWKYRKSQKAYKVVHLDAGHLSQTLYLVATALGLGAFFTGAVNDIDIEEALGIDGVEEGVIGISGCGRPRREGDALGFEARPYSPRLTKI